MVYAELHLDSGSAQRIVQSTRSVPIYELTEEIKISNFALKYANIPLTWLNISKDSPFSIALFLEENDAAVLAEVNDVYNFTLPAGNYRSMTILAEALEDIIQIDIPQLNVVVAGDYHEKLEFVFVNENRAGSITYKWGDTSLSRALNIIRSNRNSSYEIRFEIIDATDSDYITERVKLFPSFIFLCSNLMYGVVRPSWRANGADRNADVLAKIPIDIASNWGENYIDFRAVYENYFQCMGSYNNLTFYLRNEDDEILDFEEETWSLTLSMNTIE